MVSNSTVNMQSKKKKKDIFSLSSYSSVLGEKKKKANENQWTSFGSYKVFTFYNDKDLKYSANME